MIPSQILHNRLNDLEGEAIFAIGRRIQKYGAQVERSMFQFGSYPDDVFFGHIRALSLNSEGESIFIGSVNDLHEEVLISDALANHYITHRQLVTILTDLEKLTGDARSTRYVRQTSMFDPAPAEEPGQDDEAAAKLNINENTVDSGAPPDLDADFANGLGHFGM